MARLRRPALDAPTAVAAWVPADEAQEIYTEISALSLADEFVAWIDRWRMDQWEVDRSTRHYSPVTFSGTLGKLYWYTRAGNPPSDFDAELCAVRTIASIAASRRAQALGGENSGWHPDDAEVRKALALFDEDPSRRRARSVPGAGGRASRPDESNRVETRLLRREHL